jgi:hypothetical protein
MMFLNAEQSNFDEKIKRVGNTATPRESNGASKNLGEEEGRVHRAILD